MTAEILRQGATRMGALTEVGQHLTALQAHCAVDGIELHAIKDGCGRTIHIVTKGSMTRELCGLEAVAQWLGRQGPDAAATGGGA